MRAGDRAARVRRVRGLLLGGTGIALLFIPAILIVVMPGTISGYAMAGMVVGIVLLIAGFVSLPGSLQNILANKLRPKP